jgi:hypothetical protein
MQHLRTNLSDRIGALALRELLIGEIQHDENDYRGSQYLHGWPPNHLRPIAINKR